MHLEQGCVLWGYQVVIANSLRSKLLEQLHVTHMGIAKSKSFARSYFWWPKLDSDIERLCKSCKICTTILFNPNKETLHPWPYENTPWSRIHLDFFGHIYGYKYLIVIDSFSKWPEVTKINNNCDEKTVTKILQSLFTRFGIPTKIVSVNGPPFALKEFCNFLKAYGIRQLLTPPYHPVSNGQAENAVKIFKI